MTKRSFFAHVLPLSCALTLLLPPVLRGGEVWQQVAAVNAAQPEQSGFVLSGTPYRYSTGEIPADVMNPDDERRTVLYAGRLEFGFVGLNPAARYQVRAAFLSDSAERELEITAASSVLEPRLALPLRTVLAKNWELPAKVITNGELRLTVTALAGANAVVSSLEVWSTDSAQLSRPPPLADRLAQMAVPLPRISPLPADEKMRLSLDGQWKFSPALPANPASLSAADAAEWKTIQVPGEWVMQGFAVPTNQFAAYFREFQVPRSWQGQRIKLRFDTVHSVARIWVNGRAAGGHEGGFVPFELDVTDAVRPGKNTLTVGVKSESLSDVLASATQYAGHPLGGITRKVTLFAVPQVNVAALSVTTEFDSLFKDAALKLRLEIANESDATAASSALAFQLRSPDGAVVSLQPADVALPAIGARQTLTKEISIPVAAPKPWDPEHPNLYTLHAEVRHDGAVESLAQRVGFRQVEVRGNQVFVNGHPIKLHGVCRHETHPLLGRSLTPDLWRRDAEIFRAANVNYIRTSHYPPPEEFLTACDELGLFVECEAPLCWVQHGANANWQNLSHLDPQLFPYLLRANFENVVFNRNHPSIIIWSLANESLWSPLFLEVNKRVHGLDPSRPTTFHDQCWGEYNNAQSAADIAIYHYPGTNGPAKCDTGERPTLFGEYCHVQCYNQREHFTDPGIRDQWGPRFAEMYDLMYRHPGCLGGAIWSGIDEAFHLPDGEVEGYGFWGVLDGWRRAKPETFHVRKAYSPIRVTTTRLPAGVSGFNVALENRYDFTGLNEVGIHWQIGKQKGSAIGQVPARSAGELVITPAKQPAEGETLRLTFTDPRGFVAEEVALPVGEPRTALPPPKPMALGPLQIETNAAAFRISGKSFSCEVDRRNGQLGHVRMGDRTLLVGGPALMLLPLETGPCEPRDLTEFGAFNELCKNWRASAVSAQAGPGGGASVIVAGGCDDAHGSYTLAIQPDGKLDLNYDFRATKAINPRQVGMVFYVPRACDTLRWERQAEWSAYPADHIGRPCGEAKAHPNEVTHFIHLASAPKNVWSQDANFLGTADFRSTKSRLLAAALQNPDGTGVFLRSDGSQSARAFVDGNRIGWLVACINAGGGEGFFGTHHAPDRRPLRADGRIQDTIHLQLMGR